MTRALSHSSDLARFVVQRIGKGKDAHAMVLMDGRRLHGVTAVKVERMAAGLYTLELTVLSGQVTVLPDALE